jgi:hypothetical protein
MRFQKSQPAETRHECPSSASAGPLKKMDALSPARKFHAHKKKCYELPWPVRGSMKKRLPTKPVWGRSGPFAALNYPDAHHHDCCAIQPCNSEPPRQI